MAGRFKGLSVLMVAVMAISLFPAAALGLQSGTTPGERSLTVQSVKAASSSGVAKAKVSKKMVRSLYKAVLKKAVKGKGVFKDQYSHLGASDKKYWKGCLRYAVYDADRNGTPELLVQAGCFTYDMCWHMFTVSGKKVKHLGAFGSGSLMRKGASGGLYVWNQRQGCRWMTLVAILYGKVRSQDVVVDNGEARGYPEYGRYVKANGMKALKISQATKYGLLTKAS